MGIRAERLFKKLQTVKALEALIGSIENSELECKRWSTPEANKRNLSKAACGLANAEGGVIIIGMEAKGTANKPDLILGFVFVNSMSSVAASAREIISDALEPGIRDIQVIEVAEQEGKDSGCIVVYIAEEEGTPQRVRGGDFYVRMASATFPMLYSQVADRFGRRPHAKLLVDATNLVLDHQNYLTRNVRVLDLYVTNEGRGSARFPAVRIVKGSLNHYPGPYNMRAPRWPFFDDQPKWFSYRGTANDVLHPGEKIAVASLSQHGTSVGEPVKGSYGLLQPSRRFYFAAITLQSSVICEGMPEYTQSFHWKELHCDL